MRLWSLDYPLYKHDPFSLDLGAQSITDLTSVGRQDTRRGQ